MIPGRVYKVSCSGTEECYIGSTRKSLEFRLNQHIIHAGSPSRTRHTVCNQLILNHGIANTLISILEEIPECTDQGLWDRERFWIENTPNVINKNIPQPMETNQSTFEGKQGYMLAWREANKERIAEYDRNRRMNPDVKARATEQKREWREKNADHVNAQRAERVTCNKCGFEMSKGHAWEHTGRICNDKKLVREDTAKALELKSQGLSQRAIASDPYFAQRGYKPTNHDAIGRLLRNAKI